MKKIVSGFLTLLVFSFPALADHITGGEMYYTLSDFSNGQYRYAVTLKLYMRCNSARQFNNPTIVSVFDKGTGIRIMDVNVGLSSQTNISLASNANPCISNPPTVCYDVGYYNFSVVLPPNANGYVLASQVNYRIAGINNLAPGYGLIGATYTAEIPGTSAVPSGPQNHSAVFVGNDLVMVCADNPFTYSFAALDQDNDNLRYSFRGAYVSGSSGTVSPTPPPPFVDVPYGTGFSASAPLGTQVQIDQNTGLITGVAPTAGVYVVTVCVEEIRNNVVIATQRKDLQIFIAPCTIAAAVLDPEYMLCKTSKTLSVSNGSSSPLIHTYNWKFLNSSGNLLYTTTTPTANYTFADTGLYKIKLLINPDDQCSDSATSLVRVYPGFFPDFSVSGICFLKPSQFTDLSSTVYGTVNSWSWDFGEATSVNDFSIQRNPVYTYPMQGVKSVQLIATNSKGCRDTAQKAISIVDKPPVRLAFRDTLICANDQLQLHAQGNGNFTWTPVSGIINADTPDPTVSPAVTTVFTVHLNDNGCLNSDSVKVSVVDHVTLHVMNDSLICQGDTIRLRTTSDALHYSWTPAAQFIDATVPNPFCITTSNTTYQVTAIIGSCSATRPITINTAPYPVAIAGADTTICYGTTAQLHGQGNGISYRWSPPGTLSSSTVLRPVARPTTTTAYVLSSFNNGGCPKPGTDTIVVSVRARITAFAGRDTSVVVNQPLQLNATGGSSYQWLPPTYLSAANIANPVGVFTSEAEFFKYKVLVFDEAGCYDSASLLVRIYKTLPSVFVPSAFTPNGDGKNDKLSPVGVGIQAIRYFNIYNRWGQLVFSTTTNGLGWDGRVNGREQGPGTFIWIVNAVDYKGEPYIQKGTVTLIR